MLLDSRFLISQKAPDGAAADIQAAGDFRFAEASGEKITSFSSLVGDRWWAAQALTLVASVKQPGADSFAEDLALELGEYSQQPGHSAAGGRSEIQSFSKRDETNAQCDQFLE